MYVLLMFGKHFKPTKWFIYILHTYIVYEMVGDDTSNIIENSSFFSPIWIQ